MVKFKDMNLPNKLTTIRMFCVPLVLILFVLHMLYGYYEIPTDITLFDKSTAEATKYLTLDQILILVVFAAASITDALDGKIARKYNLISDYGKLMDPLADKLLVNTTLLCLMGFGKFSLANPTFSNQFVFVLQLFAIILAIITVARDIFVDALRMQALKKSAVVPAMIWGKLKTATLMPGIVVLIVGSIHPVVYSIGLALVILGGIFAIIGGVKYFTSLSKYIEE